MTDQAVEQREAAAAAEIVSRIAAGDRSAEAELVRRYGERLGFLLRR